MKEEIASLSEKNKKKEFKARIWTHIKGKKIKMKFVKKN